MHAPLKTTPRILNSRRRQWHALAAAALLLHADRRPLRRPDQRPVVHERAARFHRRADRGHGRDSAGDGVGDGLRPAAGDGHRRRRGGRPGRRLFGGSKYQVYGPTAAFIPVIVGITTKYEGYDFLIWCSLLSGVVLMIMGVARLGRLVARVPNSIVVGFTIGIAVRDRPVAGRAGVRPQGQARLRLLRQDAGHRRTSGRSQLLRDCHRGADVLSSPSTC